MPEQGESESPLSGFLGDRVAQAIEAARDSGMPRESLALLSRWWQYEAWLRELVYVELRASFGMDWRLPIAKAAKRLDEDSKYTHMRTADSENPQAYLDYSQLCEVIGEHWDIFEPSLVHRATWDGHQQELTRVRHRFAHIRRPHTDDLSRLEQFLRDLERGAFVACASYNNRWMPDPGANVPVSVGWLQECHQDAQRLIKHARDRYDTRFMLHASGRPWATTPENLEMLPAYYGTRCSLWADTRWTCQVSGATATLHVTRDTRLVATEA
ncbi:MAG: hypothetical protein IPJ14_09675 [Kineosporiaceae bacterium]|nr:hypothetical protein [Kineosporiaceae bacterium]MBK7622914.1 hypothetical protein [Kineosporiaceae bacterium]